MLLASVQIWYFKYTRSGPLHFTTADPFMAVLYRLALVHEYESSHMLALKRRRNVVPYFFVKGDHIVKFI